MWHFAIGKLSQHKEWEKKKKKHLRDCVHLIITLDTFLSPKKKGPEAENLQPNCFKFWTLSNGQEPIKWKLV